MVWQLIFMTRQPCHVWIWLCPNGIHQNIQNPIDHPCIAIVPIKMTMLDHFGILLLRQTSKHLSIGQVRRARARANEKRPWKVPWLDCLLAKKTALGVNDRHVVHITGV